MLSAHVSVEKNTSRIDTPSKEAPFKTESTPSAYSPTRKLFSRQLAMARLTDHHTNDHGDNNQRGQQLVEPRQIAEGGLCSVSAESGVPAQAELTG